MTDLNQNDFQWSNQQSLQTVHQQELQNDSQQNDSQQQQTDNQTAVRPAAPKLSLRLTLLETVPSFVGT